MKNTSNVAEITRKSWQIPAIAKIDTAAAETGAGPASADAGTKQS